MSGRREVLAFSVMFHSVSRDTVLDLVMIIAWRGTVLVAILGPTAEPTKFLYVKAEDYSTERQLEEERAWHLDLHEAMNGSLMPVPLRRTGEILAVLPQEVWGDLRVPPREAFAPRVRAWWDKATR
jgi:hypothetical protein